MQDEEVENELGVRAQWGLRRETGKSRSMEGSVKG